VELRRRFPAHAICEKYGLGHARFLLLTIETLAMRPRRPRLILCLAASLPLCATIAKAASPADLLQQALGGNEPVFQAPAADLAGAIKTCATESPSQAGACIAVALRAGRNDSDSVAPSLAAAAIQGLGKSARPAAIASVVKAAVSAAPSEVLDIVTASVKAAPRGSGPAIVTAAVSAVPHPDKVVTVNLERRAALNAVGEKQGAGKAAADGKETDGKDLTGSEKQLTLAEAIVQAAMDADPSLSQDALTAAADTGMNPDSFQTPVLTGVLAPVTPVIPGPGGESGGGSIVFGGPGPVSP
jgi:hypothetical protein